MCEESITLKETREQVLEPASSPKGYLEVGVNRDIEIDVENNGRGRFMMTAVYGCQSGRFKQTEKQMMQLCLPSFFI